MHFSDRYGCGNTLIFFFLSPFFFSSLFLLSFLPISFFPSFFSPPPLKWPYGRQLYSQLPTARPAKCFSFSQSRPQILKQLEPITFAQSKTFHQSRQKCWRATSGTRQKFWRATLHCLR